MPRILSLVDRVGGLVSPIIKSAARSLQHSTALRGMIRKYLSADTLRNLVNSEIVLDSPQYTSRRGGSRPRRDVDEFEMGI